MTFCDPVFRDPMKALACDDVLLAGCDAGRWGPVLRVWAPQSEFVVLGYGNDWDKEVKRAVCRDHGVPLLRRSSGGGTVLQTAGCLNYSVILPYAYASALETVSGANTFVMGRIAAAVQPLLDQPVVQAGHTDLTLGDQKFSGNAQRRRRRALLFHGSLLLSVDRQRLSLFLRQPSRMPDYRASRTHWDFTRNLGIEPEPLTASLRQEWDASEALADFDRTEVEALAEERRGDPRWVCQD